MSTIYTGDARFVLSGSDDGKVRIRVLSEYIQTEGAAASGGAEE